MKKIRLSLLLPIIFLVQLQQARAQTDAELVAILQEQVARISSSVIFSIDETKRSQEENISISRDNYDFTLEGKGTFIGIPEVKFLAYFNKAGQPNYFRVMLPEPKTAGNLNIDALAAGSDWKQFFLPSIFTERIMFSTWIAEFNTAKNRVSKLTLKFKIAGNLTPIEDWDITMKEIAVGYEIENPLAPVKNPSDTNYQKKISGLLSATMNVFGAEANISSNLVKDIDDWKISSDNYGIKIPLATIWEKMKGDKIMPWPAFMNEFEISKLQVDIYPTNRLDITAWTNPLGNFNFIVKRSLEDKPAPLSTQLTGGYAKSPSVEGTNTPAPTPEKKAVFEILAAYTLPADLSFGGPLTILNSFKPSSAGIVISTFKEPMDNTLPLFAGMGKGNTKVNRGITFLALVDIENFREKNLKTVLKNIAKYCAVTNPLNSILFKANLPIPPQPFSDFSAAASLNFTKDMNFFNRVFIKNISIDAKPASGDPEFSLYGTVDVVLNDPAKPLTFKGGFGIQPASLTVTGKVQMEGVMTLPHPFGFPKVSLSNLALTTGIKFSTEIPTPDNVFLSGQMMINNIAGNVTIGLDQSEIGKNMLVARYCNLDFNSVFDAFCGPAITKKIPSFVRQKIGNTGIKNVYIKLIPPGASTNFIGGYPPPDPGFTDNCYPIPTVKDNDFNPGFKLAGQAQILNWDGNFVFGFEGDMTGLSAGFTGLGNMAALPTSPLPKLPGGITLFEITGAGGKGRPELFIDLSTRHIINGITNKFSAIRSETSAPFQTNASSFLQARHSGRVLDIAGASKKMEASVQQYDLNRSGAQEFVFEPAADGYFSIRNVNSGMYLDVHMGIAEAGRKIWQYTGNGSPAQLFKPIMNSDGYFELQSKLNPNLVIEVADAGITNGSIIRINTRKQGVFNQQFRQLMTNVAADPSTATGYRENQVIYGSGQITLLGITANAYMDLNTEGFQCNLNGNILGFMKGNIQATIADFGNPLTGVSLSGSADQEAVQIIQEETRKVVKAAFGSRMANVFGSISSSFLTIRSITFSGNLDAMKSGVKMKVVFAVGGKEQNVIINADMRDMASFSKKAGEEIANVAKESFNVLMDQAEKMSAAVKEAADKGAAVMKDAAIKAFTLANNTTQDAIKSAKELKGKLTDGAKTAYNSTKDGFNMVGQKTEAFFKDFGGYTKRTVEKIFNKSRESLGNGWDNFTDAVRKAFTGGDNEERFTTNGPAFRIITKYQNNILVSPSTTKKDIPISVRTRSNSYLETWQLIPNDKNDEGSFYLVSGYSGLLVTKPWQTHLTLIPHESDHKDRERMLMEAVPNEPGWYYLKYHEYDTRSNINYYTYAEVRNVTLQDEKPWFPKNAPQWVLAPVVYAGKNRPGDMGKFKFEKAGDIDWEKTKNFPPYMAPATALAENGRYQFNGEPEQYIYSNGAFRWIPDLETLVAAKLDARPLTILPNNQQVSTVLGTPIPSRKNGALVQAQNEPEVFIMDNGVRRWIPDGETFTMMIPDGNMIQFVSKADLLAIPQGEQVPSKFNPKAALQERVLYQVPGDPSVYIVINKTFRGIPDPETLGAMGYNFSMILSITAQDLSSLPKGTALPSRRNGSMVQAINDPAVYYMENGIRRAIPDAETLNAMKLDWGKIQKVAQADLDNIPKGPDLISLK